MSETTPGRAQHVAAARAAIFDDLASITVVALAANKSERTIRRMIAAGELPVVEFGRTKLVVLSAARARLVAKAEEREPVRRGPGRPRKAA